MIINCKKLLSITTGCFLALSVFAGREPEFIEDENGIKLNLPEELINDCKDDFWTLKNDTTKAELDNILSSQESFNEWCEAQSPIDNKNPVIVRNALCKYAYFLLYANRENYTLDGSFCKRVNLGNILGSIHLKGATPCGCCCYTEAEKYIKTLKLILLDCF